MRMTTLLVAGITLTSLGACRGEEPEEEVIVDVELVESVAALWREQANLETMTVETVTDARGCDVPKYWFASAYPYNPETMAGDGIHMVDMSYPIDQYEEERPRTVMFHINEQGGYELAGIEWYFEPPGQQPLDEHPTMFGGVPMDGMMDPHVPGMQALHYDLHGWMFITHPDNDYGYFNEFNLGQTPPEWYLTDELTVFDSYKFFDPGVRGDLGYVAGDCIESAGVPHTNDSLIGTMDPFAPDTLFTDVNGIWLGSQWTVPAADVTEPPVMHGQTFDGPDADGNYFHRSWFGARVNPDGVLAPEHRFVSCMEPAIPAECM